MKTHLFIQSHLKIHLVSQMGTKKKKRNLKTRPWIRTVQPSAVSVAP